MELENLYTYAFLKKPNFSLILPQGVANQVVLINGNGLSAIIEPGISLESFQNNDDKVIQMVLTHDRIICELFRQITILPLRFGTYFTFTDNLLKHLEFHTQEYDKKLEKISNKIELTLKLIPRILPAAVPAEGGGRDYFLAKKQQYQNQKLFDMIQSQEKENLVHLITEINQLPAVIQEQEQEKEPGVKIHLLVSSSDQTLLAEQFLTWQKACPRWDLTLGDCLPPYHFI